jgi:hypothetical protein
MHIISPPSFCLSGLLNKPRLRSKKKFFDLGEALAYLTGHSGRRGGGLIICILGLKKCLTITTETCLSRGSLWRQSRTSCG